MNLSAKQIVASVVGSVAAAVIASVVSQRGTIVGVAIGAAVATTATAVVAGSIERGRDVVRTVVKEPVAAGLLRRLGESEPLGDVAHTAARSPEVTPPDRQPGRRLVTSSAASRPVPENRPGGGVPGHGVRRRWRWKPVALSAALVFVVGLVVVTVIEAVAQEPLSSLVGSSSTKGFSVGNLFTGGSSPSPTPTTTPTVPSTTSTTGPVTSSTTTSLPTAQSSTTTSTSTSEPPTTTTQP